MAKTGPKPQPAVVRELRGNPGRRPIAGGEIHLPACIPDPPDYLSDEALPFWIETAAKLEVMGVMTEVDQQALALLAEHQATFWTAKAEVRRSGLVVKIGGGDYYQQNPFLIVMNKAEKQIRDLLGEFGMTPSSRTRVRPAAPGSSSPVNSFRGRGRRPA
jgi:P27 family predicted phage terminase small subunit